MNRMPKVMSVYLRLSQYPILSREIRRRMREEIFARGVITREQFEKEVREKAILSQKHEGLSDPVSEEPPQQWQERLQIIRDHLTDFYFAMNLPFSRFEEIVRSVISVRRPNEDVILTFNPEMAPWDILFAQAKEYEKLPPEKKAKVKHHLQQIIVVLTRGMISDQLSFVGVARKHFDIFDLDEIHRRRIGRGKIGGKAAGMMLAYKVLKEDPEVGPHVDIPDSYFLGSDVFYEFLEHNRLFEFMNQKYRPYEDVLRDYPITASKFLEGKFPEEVVSGLRDLLQGLGNTPLIVRSSSLLEDNFGVSFAGKYDSFFVPNQGSLDENLHEVLTAVKKVYASTLNPNALLYRQQMGLIDYDERMAILIQRVEGSRYRDFYFPTVAGVAFSRNPFRWTPRIRKEDGFLRMVFGLGTRAVDRVANDYPRMVALSHPTLRPEATADKIRKYSQKFVDVINLKANAFETRPVSDVLDFGYPGVEYLVSIDNGDYLMPVHSLGAGVDREDMVLTFDRLLREKGFTDLMRNLLKRVEKAYGRPVDIEFALKIVPKRPRPEFRVSLLQCRPLSRREEEESVSWPTGLSKKDIVFRTQGLVPQGRVEKIRYVVYVDPRKYKLAPSNEVRFEIGRVIGRLNTLLAGETFILVGPGRWGSSNIELGVRVTYADIYNSRMLVEVAFAGSEGTPEVSFGTHFFQDLVEAKIYPLALYPGEEGNLFSEEFFDGSPNSLARILPEKKEYSEFVKVIDVPKIYKGKFLEVIMSSDEERALGYLKKY